MSRSDIRAGRAFVELFVKGAQLESALNKFAAKLRSFGREVNDVGQKMLAVGLTASIGIGAAVKRFADFDDAMRMVGAMASASDDELMKLTETAQELGATTSYAAVEVANLMAELGRAGFNPQQIEDATASILDMARASGVDAALAAKVMGASLNQFGLGADQARRVADALALTSNISATGVDDLGEALSYTGKSAANAGMSIEDTLAILAALGNVGILGSSAGTTLQRLLVITGAEAKKLEKIFGVAFTDAKGDVLPLVDTLAAVAEATKDMPTAERTAKMADAFGLLGITGAGAIGEAVDKVSEVRQQLGDAGGSAAEAAKKMDAGIGGSFRRIISAADGILISVGKVVSEAIEPFVVALRAAASGIKSWVDDNKAIVIQATALIAGITSAGVVLIGLGTAAQIAAFAFSGLAMAAGVVVSTLTLAISPLGLLAAGAFIFRDAIASAASVVADLFAPELESLSGIATDIGEDFRSASNVIGYAWTAIVDAVKSGDLALAGRIAMAALEVVWRRGTQTINELWLDAKFYALDTWNSFKFEAARIFVELFSGVELAWVNTVAFMKETWNTLSAALKKSWGEAQIGAGNLMIAAAEKAGIVSKEFADAWRQSLRVPIEENTAQNDADAARQKDEIARERERRQREIASQMTGTIATLEADRERARAALRSGNAAAREKAASDLATAEKNLAALRNEAAKTAVEEEQPGGVGLVVIDGKKRGRGRGFGGGNGDVFTTFSAFALASQVGASSGQDVIPGKLDKQIEETRGAKEEVAGLREDIKQNKLAWN